MDGFGDKCVFVKRTKLIIYVFYYLSLTLVIK